ncbi:uncharacterized protein LOC112622283 [Theropithecus gelada]|uniref:uncharacterized protein LOC112622283 n=1 Tax=Theropithecus gelada TaxID=9565 RepID=UPI000DC17B47|nr:uncharacterized protein LOC112622283 [Theropithecus gelada]
MDIVFQPQIFFLLKSLALVFDFTICLLPAHLTNRQGEGEWEEVTVFMLSAFSESNLQPRTAKVPLGFVPLRRSGDLLPRPSPFPRFRVPLLNYVSQRAARPRAWTPSVLPLCLSARRSMMMQMRRAPVSDDILARDRGSRLSRGNRRNGGGGCRDDDDVGGRVRPQHRRELFVLSSAGDLHRDRDIHRGGGPQRRRDRSLLGLCGRHPLPRCQHSPSLRSCSQPRGSWGACAHCVDSSGGLLGRGRAAGGAL